MSVPRRARRSLSTATLRSSPPLWTLFFPLLFSLLYSLLFPGAALSQNDDSVLPTLTPEDYAQWEVLQGNPVLSRDGRWLAYRVRQVDRDSELRLQALDGDAEHVFPWGEAPEFSADSAWLAWRRGLSEKEKERLAEKDEPARNGIEWIELASGEKQERDAVSAFSFDKSGRFLALLGYAPDEPKGKGADLVLLDLKEDSATTFGNVGEYAWSEVGSLLALAIANGSDSDNGVQTYDAIRGRLRSLDSSGSAYHGLAWREEGADLAFLRSVKPASEDGSDHTLVAWQCLDGDDPEKRELVSERAAGNSEPVEEIVRHHVPEWSDDRTLLSFGLRPREEDEEAEEESTEEKEAVDEEPGDEDDPETPGDEETEEQGEDETEKKLPAVQIWHSNDVRLFPEQKAAEKRDEQRVLLAVWHLESSRVVRIGTDLNERSQLLEGWRHGLERVAAPYSWGRMFGRPYHDAWTIDITTGQRAKTLERERYVSPSAGGAYLLSFDGEHHWATELATGQRVNLTADLGAKFGNQEYDTPTDRRPPYGVGGWLEGDRAVLLYSRFDVWRVEANGSGEERITRGEEEELVHRVLDLDPEEEAIDPTRPIYFSLRGERTEQRGFARLSPGAAVAERLLLGDKMHGRLTKAEDVEVYVYRSEARDDSPDYFVSGPELSSARQVTETNAFQSEYAWTRAELFDFESEAGVPLQAGLLYPAGHDPSQTHPMIVYTYEILAPQLHFYEPPDERDYYNFTAWTQKGYFVLLPDIVYRAREPGLSALEAVRPAVNAVVDRGLVDADRVGLIGHSWGGYQATFLPTRTDLFAAAVAGAPLTDFVSFMGQIHWNPGIAELSHWETGQARMEVPFWEDPEAHRRASPIHKVHEMETPLLMAFGNEDGVVDWDQGTEFYNFARRAGKQMVLLVYEGEDHGFRTEANQIDYHRRILEWFGHYLKGEDAPSWITEGVPLEKLEEEKKRVANRSEAGQKPAEKPP